MEQNNIPGGGTSQILGNSLRIENLIGRGGMGTVYRATHLGLDRVVAVKILNPEFAANSEISQRFAREARLMAKLRHPRAATIYDSGTLADGRLFITMEYVDGVTLGDVLKQKGRLAYKEAVDIAVSICDVLGAAHSLGIIHRDLKPANIMLNLEGVFVLDFGIAKMLNADSAESMQLSMTNAGSLVGTPFYMSPEQCLGNPVEARSDLYSLGALLFEMIAGHPPFNEEALSAVIIKHAMVEPPRLIDVVPNVPPALSDIVNRLLSKKPEDRPANAAEAKILLESSIGAQTLPMNNPITQTTNTGFEPVKVTEHLKVQTDPQMPKPLMPNVPDTPVKRKNMVPLVAGITAACVLVSIISVAVIVFINWPSQTISNTNTASNYASNINHSNMNHSGHNMGNMGDDFVKNTNPEDKTSTSMPLLSTEEADKIITEITRTTEHHADGMQIVKTPKDSALICLHSKIAEGKSHMFAVERPNPNSPWEISARTSLDVPEFHGAQWTFEPQDVDGDSFEEVIFFGINQEHTAHRWLVYVPRTRQSYTLLSAKDASGKVTNTFSVNALTPNGAPFKSALEKLLKEH